MLSSPMNSTPLPAATVADWQWHTFTSWPHALLYEAMRLRSEIFVVEQTCIFPDMDGIDPDCLHLCGLSANGTLLAYARLVPPGVKYVEPSIGRVVVASAARGTQLGRALMVEAIAGTLARFPGKTLRIGAQQRLHRFYESLGFAQDGEPYLEDGIWHIEMLRAA
jgi:ElaA protein